VRAGKEISEYDVQQEMVRLFAANGLITDEPPCVAVNANTANPHTHRPRRPRGPFMPMISCYWMFGPKQNKPGAVYFDITWTGYVGEKVLPNNYQGFEVVREARDMPIILVQKSLQAGRILYGIRLTTRRARS